MARPFLAAVGLVFVAHSYAWAQTPIQISATTPTVTTTPTATTTPTRWKKFEGSGLYLYSYIGSGTFYTSGYTNDYASLALFGLPTYDLGTRYKLALRARLIIEQELTQPDDRSGTRFHPFDPWIWLAADNLRTFERTKIKIGGTFRTVWPVAPESRYRHDVVTVGVGPNVSRAFEFGQVNDEARKWTLKVSYGLLFSKAFQTSNFRGSGPGDSTGCMAPGSPAASGGGRRPQRIVRRHLRRAGQHQLCVRQLVRARAVPGQGVAQPVPGHLQRLQVRVPGGRGDRRQRRVDGPLRLDLGHPRRELQAAPPSLGWARNLELPARPRFTLPLPPLPVLGFRGRQRQQLQPDLH